LTKYRLKCTGNLEVVRGTKTGTSITYSATAIADTTDILPGDATNLYFARAKSAGTGIDKVTLYKVVNGTETVIESTAFEARQTLDGWIVPSGWKIETTQGVTPITMPMLADGNTIGPQTEGSGPVGSEYDNKGGEQSPTNPRGDAFTVDTYNKGFTMTLKFSFVRSPHTQNRPSGYVRPDYSGNFEQGVDPGRNEIY
jgi:hypothetical protein